MKGTVRMLKLKIALVVFVLLAVIIVGADHQIEIFVAMRGLINRTLAMVAAGYFAFRLLKKNL